MLVAEQVGAAEGADHQRPAREQRRRRAVDDEEVGEVVGRVARRGDRPQRRRPPRARRSRPARRVGADLEAGRPRDARNVGAVGGELGAAGDVVGMRVGVGGPRDPPAPLGGHLALPVGEPGRVDHQRRAVTEADDVGGVPEALVDDAHDRDRRARYASSSALILTRWSPPSPRPARRARRGPRCGRAGGPGSGPSSTRRQNVTGCSDHDDRDPAPGGVVGDLPRPARVGRVAVVGPGPVGEPAAVGVELLDGGSAAPRLPEGMELDDPLGARLEHLGLVDDRPSSRRSTTAAGRCR